MNLIIKKWDENPLFVILSVAVFLRLISVFFAGGYGYHDDHFLVIEPAQGWLEGRNPGKMIVDDIEDNKSGRSLLYPGILSGVFWMLESVSIHDPLVKMWVLRLLHAAYSLLIVVFGYRIVETIATKEKARFVGLLLATYWMFPQIGVRNLVEAVPTPLMMYGSLILLRYIKGSGKIWQVILCGVLMGICFSLRYQTLFFTAGLGLGFLILKKWKEFFYFSTGVALLIVLLHGIGDYFLCGSPFCKVIYYFVYNMDNASTYFDKPWFDYVLLLLGLFIPPISIFLLFGFFRAYKIDLLLWLPVLVFFVFHSMFPNKQERFIFTVMPQMLLLGYLGWTEFMEKSGFWAKRKKLIAGFWIFFWVLNIPVSVIYSAYYNKKARIEGMVYLRERGDVKNFFMIDKTRVGVKDAPLFYLGKKVPYIRVTSNSDDNQVKTELEGLPDAIKPNYLIIMRKQGEDLTEKENHARFFFEDFTYLTTAEMGLVDGIRNSVNKHIKLDDWAIYKINN